MTREQVDELVAALRAEFDQALVDAEEVREGRYRFAVVWDGFEDRPHRDRQKAVWAIADRLFPGPTLLDVAMIITMSSSETPQPLY